jgi:hypothetical protein
MTRSRGGDSRQMKPLGCNQEARPSQARASCIHIEQPRCIPVRAGGLGGVARMRGFNRPRLARFHLPARPIAMQDALGCERSILLHPPCRRFMLTLASSPLGRLFRARGFIPSRPAHAIPFFSRDPVARTPAQQASIAVVTMLVPTIKVFYPFSPCRPAPSTKRRAPASPSAASDCMPWRNSFASAAARSRSCCS